MSVLNLPSLLGSAASAVPGGNAISGALSLVTGLFGAKHDYRPARAAEVFSMVQHGEPYAVDAARIIYKQKTGSHTDAGRAAYAQAWALTQQGYPSIAAQAVAKGGLDDPAPGVPNEGSYVPNPASVTPPAVSSAAQQVQNVGAGLTTAAANAINPNSGAVTIPTNKMALILIAIVIVVGGALLLRGRK